MFRLAYTKPGYAESIITEVTGGRLQPTFDEIQDVRIDRQLTAGMGNDLAFVVNGEVMILVEAQSYTIKNIPLRMLFYVADILKDKYWKNSSVPAPRIPTIHLYVLYSGNTGNASKTLSLSDMMVSPIIGLPVDLNVTVHVLSEEDARVPKVRQYFQFCRIVNLCREKIQDTDADSFRFKFRAELLRYCRAYGIFTDIIEDYVNEFEEVVYTMTDFELAKIYEREEGRAEGVLQAAHEAYASLIAQNIPIDVIRRTVISMGVSEEELRVIEEKYLNKTNGSESRGSVPKLTLE